MECNVRRSVAMLIGLLFGLIVLGQNTGDCFNAIAVCQGVYTEENSPPGEGDLPDEISATLSCLGGGEVDGQWYTFTVANSGQFCFSILPNNLANDYDWAVFNLTNASCSDIATNASLEVSCNFSGTPGVTGANAQGGAQNNPCIPVQTGQTYVLYVSNWSQSTFGYTLNTQIPGSTASIFDNAPPTLTTTINVECPRTEVEFAFSEQVLCASVQSTDISITGPGATYTITAVTSATCAAGGDQSNDFVAVVSPSLSGTGPFTMTIAGEVLDLCGNVSPIGASITFMLDEEMTLELTAEPTNCGGPGTGVLTAVPVNGQGPFVYRLNGGSPQVNNGVYDDLAAGIYTISVLDALGCTASTEGEVVVASDLNNTITATNVICFGQANGTAIVQTTGANGSWNYTWYDTNQAIVRTTLNSAGDMLTAGPGIYTVVVQEILPGVNCADTLTAEITEPTELIWITVPADTTICRTGVAVLNAETTGGTDPVQLAWTPALSGPGPHLVSPTTNAVYSVQATDAHGCTLPAMQATVNVRAPLSSPPLEAFTICNGVPFTIDVSSTTGGDGDLVYQWNNGAPEAPIMTDTLYMSTNLCLTIHDGCETPPLSSCATITVLQAPPLRVIADSVLGCPPFQLRFALEDTSGMASVLWNFSNGVSVTGADSIDYIYPAAGTFDVTTTVTWPNGCVTDTTIIDMIRVMPIPTADFTWAPNPLTVLEPVARFIELAAPNEEDYAWDFFQFGTSNEADPEVIFPNDVGRYYPVQLRVANALGCMDSVIHQVHVEDEFLVYVPNAFSPNGDGINELFGVSGNDLSLDEFELRIFDRWGHEVFAATDRLRYWDGTLNGNALPNGVYNWRLNIRSKQTLQKRIMFGHVTLLR